MAAVDHRVAPPAPLDLVGNVRGKPRRYTRVLCAPIWSARGPGGAAWATGMPWSRKNASARPPTVLGGPLLTVEQTAERLGTSVRFVRRLVAERRIAVIRVGRHVRIAPADLAAFVAAGRSEPLPRRP